MSSEKLPRTVSGRALLISIVAMTATAILGSGPARAQWDSVAGAAVARAVVQGMAKGNHVRKKDKIVQTASCVGQGIRQPVEETLTLVASRAVRAAEVSISLIERETFLCGSLYARRGTCANSSHHHFQRLFRRGVIAGDCLFEKFDSFAAVLGTPPQPY